MKLTHIAAIAVALLSLPTVAEARSHHRYHRHYPIPQRIMDRQPTHASSCIPDNNGRTACSGISPASYEGRSTERTSDRPKGRVGRFDLALGATIIGGRPSGCPHAYCGCGARLYLGLSDVRLNLAWNWTKYYSGPTPVAVWRHHIAIIEQWTGPNMAILRDYNSGHGLSRIHERSTAGATIIGARYASR